MPPKNNNLYPFAFFYKKSKLKTMAAKDIFNQSHLALSLMPLTIRELINLQTSPCDIYAFEKGHFTLVFRKGSYIDAQSLKNVIAQGHITVFSKEEARKDIIELQQHNLRAVTRSFSMGNSLENCKKQLSLLTLNMRYLFEDPTNDETLNLQYQSLKILFKYLYDNPKKHEQIYLDFIKQGHHYIFTQPLVSSIFLLGILKLSHIYNEKDVESLFIASYFKDIGMSSIPVEKFDVEELTENDKKILTLHPDTSVKILQGRLPLSPSHFKIIEAHHSFSTLRTEMVNPPQSTNDLTISGIETMLVNITDIVAAVISPRPYRASLSLFHALDLVKILMSSQHPTEFKMIVNYFRNFFTNTVS